MKNKRKADIILTTLILIFLLSALLKHFWGEPFILKMFIFIIEAALVGSIADWFAVTILFKKPLGLPINPIIPSNKDKILNSLSSVVNNNLLNMNYIEESIKKVPIAKNVIKSIDNKELNSKIIQPAIKFALSYLQELKYDITKAAKFTDYIKTITNSSNTTKAKLLKHLFGLIESQFTIDSYNKLINLGIKFCKDKFAVNTLYKLLTVIFNLKHLKTIKKLANLEDLSKAIQSEIIDFLKEIEFSNEKYEFVKNRIYSFIGEYLKNSDLRKILWDMADSLITDERMDKILRILENLFAYMSDDNEFNTDRETQIDANLQAAANIVTNLVQDLWKEIKNDPKAITWLDYTIKGLIIDITSKNRIAFTRFIEDQINGFTDEQLSNLIQNSAGEPLHWIRINGAMLGGILGIVLFSFINFLYEPYLLPLAHKFIGML